MKSRILEKRKGIIDFDRLMDLLGFENYDDLIDAHYKWVDSAMQTDNSDKENKWTQSIAVKIKRIDKDKKDKKIRYCFFSTNQTKMVNCVSVSASAQNKETGIEHKRWVSNYYRRRLGLPREIFASVLKLCPNCARQGQIFPN